MHQVQWLQSGDDRAIDGKGLANTLVHHKDAGQNFVNVVSLFQFHTDKCCSARPSLSQDWGSRKDAHSPFDPASMRGIECLILA
jgi:hypothetical protein